MARLPQTPKHTRAGASGPTSGPPPTASRTPDDPPANTTKEPATTTETVTITRTTPRRIRTRTITTTTTLLFTDTLPSTPEEAANEDDDDFFDALSHISSDSDALSYVSSPSPLLRNIPLPLEEVQTNVEQPIATVHQRRVVDHQDLRTSQQHSVSTVARQGSRSVCLQVDKNRSSNRPQAIAAERPLTGTQKPKGPDRQSVRTMQQDSTSVIPRERVQSVHQQVEAYWHLNRSQTSTVEHRPTALQQPRAVNEQRVRTRQDDAAPSVSHQRTQSSSQQVAVNRLPTRLAAVKCHPSTAQEPEALTNQGVTAAGHHQHPVSVVAPQGSQWVIRQNSTNAAGRQPPPPVALEAQGPSRRIPAVIKLPKFKIIKVYIAPKPESLTPIPGNIDLYTLTGGGGGGIYISKAEALGLCDKAGWKNYKKSRGWSKALEVYKSAWNKGTILIEPDPDGPFAELPFIELAVEEVNQPLPNQIPRPEDLVCPVKEDDYYYVVIHGEEVGIFGSWHDAAIRTQKVKGGRCYKFAQWINAYNFYREKRDSNQITLCPRRYGFFDPLVAKELRAAVKSVPPS